jgi:hypothetical protein
LRDSGTDAKYVGKKKMSKKILAGLMLILLIGIVSASYPGETIIWNNELSNENLSYHLQGNPTNLPNMSITITKTKIFVTLPANMPPCSFDIVFTLNEIPKPEPNPFFWWWYPRNRYYFSKPVWVYPNRFYFFFPKFMWP